MQPTVKRIAKLSISIGYFGFRWAADFVRRIFGLPLKGSAVILYYHRIRPDEREKFARQLDVLRRWAKPVDVAYRTPQTGGRFAAVTFDDGFVSFCDTALPELQQRQIPVTLFVVSERLGCVPDWDEYIEDPTFNEPILTAERLLTLPQDLVRIGSHTLTHPFLTRVDEPEARRQLRESRIQLEKLLNRKVTLFSFPHGDHHASLVDWCRDAGYDRVYTILPDDGFPTSTQYAVGRVGTDPSDWPLEFLLKLLGAYRWLPLAFALKRKIRALFGSRKLSAPAPKTV